MTTGHTGDMPVNSGTDWVREYLSQPLPYKPGSYFCYERMTGYMLSAIVQRISGQKLIDYLQPRLFEPLGIQSATWQESPQGINTGGWGLQASTQDMARIGTMLVQKGKWDGKRILSKAWIKQMMQYQTESSPRDVPLKDIVQSGLNDYENDWIQGFGYQMWLSRLNEFARAEDGNGKFLLVIPKYDAVVAINTDSEKVQSELNSVFYHISPALQEWRGKKEKRHRTDTTPHLHRM
jgi:CubicO group peptidase (beta-lactamase class C family)